ncbi:MAG TPA: chorion class high-cysteine HCB protein 13 [Lachnospiraceae bacterium]|jgi:hypothetical protein|nr:chorion class high-cysteine HCB protein 13 [Lachnospiraceae bacterium]HCA69141.1 chorion class high-cysteine HCB protein 13 [Lachnospiraceae bacterium]HCM13697.1 chorion class high-cysteine HCB protein 13 [Lachnospiraceae bacterium]
MSDLTSTSYFNDKKNDTGMNPIFLIFILLFLCGGDNGMLGCLKGGNECGCNNSNGLDGILPILLLFCLCGGF